MVRAMSDNSEVQGTRAFVRHAEKERDSFSQLLKSMSGAKGLYDFGPNGGRLRNESIKCGLIIGFPWAM